MDADELRALLTTRIAEHGDITEGEIDQDQPVEEFGLSSRDAVSIAGELQDLLGRPLEPTLVWQYPTINRLVEGLTTTGASRPAPALSAGANAAHGGGANSAIAVVGLGCRLPGGVRGPAQYWRLLLDGVDAITQVPLGRWEAFDDGSPAFAELLASTTRWGGFLDEVDGFDAEFFGITPREAELMDPQQRLILEVAWEALEHAGLAPRSLGATRTGVFVGASSSEYAYLTMAELGRLEGWTATGGSPAMAANRLSYLLDLHGPSMVVDTACSSSLVAVHLAARSLRCGESDLALAGGVNLLLSPLITRSFDQAGGTAPDGRCKAFSADADGIGRGEGCGMVVLKRLADARRDGDPVLAILRGSAVNSDGRSNGLLAPNPQAQRRVLRDACADAGVDPAEIDYVEAHGTGTALGDPIEAGALSSALCPDRPAHRPLLVGSAKTNLGHLEAAAGVAGLIKTVLALHHRHIPASLHCDTPSPHIDFNRSRLQITAHPTPWPEGDRPARAGVSSFGFGGTNAHLVLEAAGTLEGPGILEAPGRTEAVSAAPAPRKFVLSDLTADRVAEYAVDLAAWLRSPGGERAELGDVAHTLARRVGRGPARSVVVARDRAELLTGLTALASHKRTRTVVSGQLAQSAGATPGPVWVFSGYQTKWPKLGPLLDSEPEFAAALDEIDALVREEAGFSPAAALREGPPPRGPEQIMRTVFCVQIALARLWRHHGVAPAAVLGHSMGEVAAAVVAGGLSAEDGVRVIVCRSSLLSRLAGRGAMAALGVDAEDVVALGGEFPDVHVAVRSAPGQCVATGDRDQVAALVEQIETQGRSASLIDADGAGHSPQVDALLPELARELAGLGGGPPTLPFYSSVSADPRRLPVFDAGYWAANLRQPVRFTDAVAAAAQDGYRLFTEVSPHPLLGAPITETLEHHGVSRHLVTGTLRRNVDPVVAFHTALATLDANGVPGTDQRLQPPATVIDLPNPPWRHIRHWVDPLPRRVPRVPAEPASSLDGKLFELRWQPCPLPYPHSVPEPRRWLVLAEPGALGTELAGALRSVGDHVEIADRTEPGARRSALEPDGVVLLLPDQPAKTPTSSFAQQLVLDVCAVLRDAVNRGSTALPRLWLVSSGSRALCEDETGQPDLACLRGVVRVLALEHPNLRCCLIDLDPTATAAANRDALRLELTAGTAHDEVAWRDGTRYSARLVRTGLGAPQRDPVVRRDGGYLITGGYGGLGLVVAGWLARHGAHRVVLCGRHGPSRAADKTIAGLREAGCDVRVVTGDVAEPGVTDRLVAEVRADGVALCGVAHAAGGLDDRLALEVGKEDLACVWSAKAEGAWQLHLSTAGVELDWWVAFSSAAALLGSPGQLAYATANAWLDALVAWRRGHGLPATTVNWGTWAEVGGVAEGNRVTALRPITPTEGTEALGALLAGDRAATGVFAVAVDVVTAGFPNLTAVPYFAELLAGTAPRRQRLDDCPGDDWSGIARVRAAAPTEARRLIAERVRDRICDLVGIELDRDSPLLDAGLDSLIALRVKNVLEHDFAVTIPPSTLLRGASLADVEKVIAAGLGVTEAPHKHPAHRHVGARDAAERLAVRAFENALGVAALGVRDDFFTLGGEESQALRMLDELQPHLDAAIHLPEVREHPTAEALAELIRDRQRKPSAGLVRALRTTGERGPLFLAHPAGGDTHVYRQLVQLLHVDQPCYGLERVVDTAEVQARAARYAELITEVRPAGPYRLGGWSFGGVLAYETARLLTEAGAEVSLVVLLDAGLPLPLPADTTAERALARRLAGFASYLTETYGRRVELDVTELAELDETAQFELTMRQVASAGLHEELSPAILHHQVTSHEDTRALERYQPRPYAGRIVLYRSTEATPWAVRDPRFERTDEALGWDAFCPDLTVVPVPAHHLNLLDPPTVHVIAEHLETLLTQPGKGDTAR